MPKLIRCYFGKRTGSPRCVEERKTRYAHAFSVVDQEFAVIARPAAKKLTATSANPISVFMTVSSATGQLVKQLQQFADGADFFATSSSQRALKRPDQPRADDDRWLAAG